MYVISRRRRTNYLVHDVTECGQQRRVHHGDPEAQDADGHHEHEVVGAPGDEEAGAAVQHHAHRRHDPGVFGELGLHLHGQDDAANLFQMRIGVIIASQRSSLNTGAGVTKEKSSAVSIPQNQES